MSWPVIDAHIHLDMYDDPARKQLLAELPAHQVERMIAVSNHLASAEKTLGLARLDSRVHPAFGYHPEQDLPSDRELEALLAFCRIHADEMIAIGEVGLPYYLRREQPEIPLAPYLELLETFIRLAAELDKPVILHAIYDDASPVCDLLEKHAIKRAHFHWFKGDTAVVRRIVKNGYKISVTPDCLYEAEIADLICQVPLEALMAETDGPWPFEGPFKGKLTHPNMIHQSIRQIAELKQLPVIDVYTQIYRNTKAFYSI